MARPKDQQKLAMLQMSHDKARRMLDERIRAGHGLIRDDPTDARREFQRWLDYNVTLLKKIFSTDEYAANYCRPRPMAAYRDPAMMCAQKLEDHLEYVRRLESIRDRLELHDIEDGGAAELTVVAGGSKLFVAFGHDEASASRLAVMLHDNWGLEPVLLRDLAGRGRTLIEKLEQTGVEIGYCIAVFTPDDTVQSVQGDYNQARPNVLFELGWFCGRLGRDHTLILARRGTKIPSDLEGIERLEFTNEVDEAGLKIQKELKSAGLI